MISEPLRQLLVEILSDTEALHKISVAVDPVSRSVAIVYADLDDEWFREVSDVSREPFSVISTAVPAVAVPCAPAAVIAAPTVTVLTSTSTGDDAAWNAWVAPEGYDSGWHR